METLQLKNGKTVSFDYYLARNGAHFYTEDKLTQEEKAEFMHELKHARDVLSLKFYY